mmetsp:Transcript_88371/g.156447  ORF Transcript_88371/g.156447 Transcript_88371/m.156447 type:complete len:229 (-) Transcript_88371:144-830(-)
MAKSSKSSPGRRLEILLLEEPSEGLRDDLFALVIKLKEEDGMTQREVADVLSLAKAVWSAKALGNQMARLEPLEDVIAVVQGFEDSPSPLFGETLKEPAQTPGKADPEFLAASSRAAECVARSHGSSLAHLEAQRAAAMQELEALLKEEQADNDRSKVSKKKIGGTVVVYETEDESARIARRQAQQLEDLKEEAEKLQRQKQLREDVEKEWAAFAAEEALLAEEARVS